MGTNIYSFYIKDYFENMNGEKEMVFRHLCDAEFWKYRSLSKVREMLPEKIDGDYYFLNITQMYKASDNDTLDNIRIKKEIKDEYNEKIIRCVYLVKKEIYDLPSEEEKRIEFEKNPTNFKNILEKREEQLEKMDHASKVIGRVGEMTVNSATNVAKVVNIAQNVIDFKPGNQGVEKKIENEHIVKEEKIENGKNAEKCEKNVKGEIIEDGINIKEAKNGNGQNVENQQNDKEEKIENVTLEEIPKEQSVQNI